MMEHTEQRDTITRALADGYSRLGVYDRLLDTLPNSPTEIVQHWREMRDALASKITLVEGYLTLASEAAEDLLTSTETSRAA
jgi:hypothetical protein